MLSWACTIVVLALAVPGPWGSPHLGVTVVSGPSMLPTYDPGDLVVTWRTDAYPVGTPVVYRIPAGGPGAGLNVVHRVVEVTPDGRHITQGDNNDHVDPWQPTEQNVRGEVVLRVPRGGILLRLFASPIVLAALCGILVTASMISSKRGRGDDPPDGPGPPRRRRRWPGGSVLAMAVAVLAVAAPARAADLGQLEAADLLVATAPSSIAANPVSYEQHLTSETALQYCATVTVTNHSAQAVQWEITLNISGQPYNASSVASSYGVTTVSFQPDLWRVRGADYNAVLAAGGTYDWGYCGARSPTGLVDATVSVAVTQSEAQSYCATATVSTASTDWIRWRATLGHATTGISDNAFWLAAEPTNTNSMTTISFDAVTGTWVTRGVASNEYIRSGTNATFGYWRRRVRRHPSWTRP
jgi:signal peptidase